MDLLLLQSLVRLDVLALRKEIFTSLSRRSAVCINVARVYCGVLGTTPGSAYPPCCCIPNCYSITIFFTEASTAMVSFRAYPGSVQSIQHVRWNPEKLLVGFPSTRLSSLVPALSIQLESATQTTSSPVSGMQIFLAHPKILEKNQSLRG